MISYTSAYNMLSWIKNNASKIRFIYNDATDLSVSASIDDIINNQNEKKVSFIIRASDISVSKTIANIQVLDINDVVLLSRTLNYASVSGKIDVQITVFMYYA